MDHASGRAGTTNEERAFASLPKHLIRLPASPWTIWRCIGLRAAGFPAVLPTALAASASVALADELLDAADRSAALHAEALSLFRQAVHTPEGAQNHVIKAIRRLRKGQVPAITEELDGELKGALEKYRTARAELESVRDRYERTFEAEILELSEAVGQVAQMESFQEAMIWQNRSAVHNGVEPLLRSRPGAARNARRRLHEELVTFYLQRYCLKNDTIGFFGPMGWANAVDQGPAISARPGPHLLAARGVRLEQWCVDALVKALTQDPAFRPWIPPRRSPFIHIHGRMLYVPSQAPVELESGQAAVLGACDGEHTARQIAQELVQNSGMGFTGEDQVYRLLDSLCEQGLVYWNLQIPFEQMHPEASLRQWLEQIGDETLRQRAMQALDDLEGTVGAVARAAGCAEKLDHAMGEFEATFTRLTETAPTRSAGKTYAARTLIFEDCRRDLECEVGPELLQSLAAPLSLLLTSARWLTFEAAKLYRARLGELFEELTRSAGSPSVDLVSFWSRAQPLFFGEGRPMEQVVLPAFQERWAAILSPSLEQRSLEYSAAALAPRVSAAFQAPGPGWRFARLHSPDLMIQAASQEAIRRGDYRWVMGELHLAMNALRAACLVSQHPSPADAVEAYECDLQERGVTPVVPRDWPEISSRTFYAFIPPRDHRLLLTADACGVPPELALPIGALVVEKGAHGLVVRSRDGKSEFDIVEFFGEPMSQVVVDSFKMMPTAPHTPRMAIDRLVIWRETWRCAVAEIPFADEPAEAERFLAARRWRRAHGLPRYVFVKAPTEVKPFFVDFDSPLFVNTFAKVLRRVRDSGTAEPIKVTEMLPPPPEVWLPDGEGQRYTSELRVVAVDVAGARTWETGLESGG